MSLIKCHILLILLWVLWACVPEAPVTGVAPTPGNDGAITIRGLVCDGAGQPLDGVVVSDCRKCVKTDWDGRFSLDSDTTARFVYVSIPSGYTVPTKDGLPLFYKRLSEEAKVGGCYNVEFVLDKMQQNPDKYSVLMVADPQPRTRNRGFDCIAYHSLDCCLDLYRDMRETGRRIRHKSPCYAIVLGDITHEIMGLFDEYVKEGTSTMGFPTFNVLGNHDNDTKASTDEEGTMPFEERFGPSNYSFNLGKIHYVVVDNTIHSLGSDGKLTAYKIGLRDDIMEWVRADLALVDKSSTIMLCMHAPMFLKSKSSENKDKLAAELKRFKKVHEWSGHVHVMNNNCETELENLEAHNIVRATGELWTNEWLSVGCPRGYVVVDVDGEDISWKYKPTIYQTGQPYSTTPDYVYRRWDFVDGMAVMKSTGKPLDDSYQMNVYPRGAYGDDCVYANVFMWDQKWEKPVYVSNEGSEYEMNLVTNETYRYDVGQWEIYDFYKANSETLKNTNFTDDFGNTIFRVDVPDVAVSGGYVKVKDRFGNEYIQEVEY